MTAKDYSDDPRLDAANDLLNNVRTAKDRDGIHYNRRRCTRWQKHGHDRIYFETDDYDRAPDHDGYIDLDDGGVTGSTPVDSVDVDDGRVHYRDKDGDTLASRPL